MSEGEKVAEMVKEGERALSLKASELHRRAVVGRERFEKLVSSHRNAFTSSKMFHGMCHSAFETVDISKNGAVGLAEAYVAVLLFYARLSKFAKGLTPPKVDEVETLFKKVAHDDDELDEDGFAALLTLLLEHLIFRVLLETLITF